MKISIECSDLICEVKRDICEFGENTPCYIFYDEIAGCRIATSYDFIAEESPLTKEEEEDTEITTSTLGAALKIFEEQNRVI